MEVFITSWPGRNTEWSLQLCCREHRQIDDLVGTSGQRVVQMAYHRHKYGKTKPWSTRSEQVPTGRERLIARALIAGANQRDSVRCAGYRPSTIKAKSYEIVKRPGVRAAIIEIAQTLVPQLPAVGNFSQQQMQASFSAELVNPETNFDELVAMIRGATKFIIDAASLRPSPKPHNKRPELTPEQKANLEQRVVELQRSAAQVSPREAGDTKSLVNPDIPVMTISEPTLTPSPPAEGGVAAPSLVNEPDPALLAIAEAQRREIEQRQLRERQRSGSTKWWSKK